MGVVAIPWPPGGPCLFTGEAHCSGEFCSYAACRLLLVSQACAFRGHRSSGAKEVIPAGRRDPRRLLKNGSPRNAEEGADTTNRPPSRIQPSPVLKTRLR